MYLCSHKQGKGKVTRQLVEDTVRCASRLNSLCVWMHLDIGRIADRLIKIYESVYAYVTGRQYMKASMTRGGESVDVQ